jgi:hypothetical protein
LPALFIIIFIVFSQIIIIMKFIYIMREIFSLKSHCSKHRANKDNV